jgi:glycosyltransferase involved in cell wall biosynthesis
MEKKILFISHEASLTGATIVLLHFLKWFKANTDIPFEIILKKGGILVNEFRSLAPVTNLQSKKNIIIESLQTLFKHYGFRLPLIDMKVRTIRKKFLDQNIGLIYSNTVTNGEIMEQLKGLNAPFICHVHELEWGIQYYGQNNFNRVKKLTNKFIAVSKSVSDNLINNHNVSNELIDINYEFVPTKYYSLIDQKSCRDQVCQSLNIPENAHILCASGTTGWRKGPDLFIEVACLMRKLKPDIPIYFLWVGGDKQGQRYYDLKHDIEKSGLKRYVHFLGEQKDPSIFFAACDFFLMVSREDPFPLVCLEAAALGKPIVCFDEAGGMKEFVEDDSGAVVPYLDILEMANISLNLIQTPSLRKKLGQKAKAKVVERHDIEVSGPKLLQTIIRSMHTNNK